MLLAGLSLAAAVTALVLWVAWRVNNLARSNTAPSAAQAIVMLGAQVKHAGEASPALARRAEKAAELYRQGLAPLVIFTGGPRGQRPSEAGVACELATRLGVPASACVLEEESNNTFENAERTAPLLRARGIDAVVLISDGYHLFRARLRFAEQGIRVQTVASERRLSGRDRAYWTVREALAVLRTPGALLR